MTDREARDAAVAAARAALKTEIFIAPIVEKAIDAYVKVITLDAEECDDRGFGLAPANEEDDALLDEWDDDYDDDYCSVCDILLSDLGGSSHYHCAYCGKETGMMGHYTTYADGESDFDCNPKNQGRKRI